MLSAIKPGEKWGRFDVPELKDVVIKPDQWRGKPKLLTTAERAALVAAENAKPKQRSCCG